MAAGAGLSSDRRVESLDRRNRRTFGSVGVVDVYRRASGWLDAGERKMLSRIADETRGARILDIGVGGGRTASLLRLLTASYVGIDYSPEMVRACLEDDGTLDVRLGDARDLSAFSDGEFKLVLFSYNGLDALDHGDRARAVAEIHRVLEPCGLFLYCTTNKNGPNYGRRPWRAAPSPTPRTARRLLGALWELPGSLPRHVRSYRNWRRASRTAEDRGAWAIGPLHAHEYGLSIHFTLPSTERAMLGGFGFGLEEMLSMEGWPVVDDASTTKWFHVLARKGA